jgi:hypothetical protein
VALFSFVLEQPVNKKKMASNETDLSKVNTLIMTFTSFASTILALIFTVA